MILSLPGPNERYGGSKNRGIRASQDRSPIATSSQTGTHIEGILSRRSSDAGSTVKPNKLRSRVLRSDHA